MFRYADKDANNERPRRTHRASYQILNILEPMMADFKGEISELRAEGASQAEIDAMLDELEEVYASSDNPRAKTGTAYSERSGATASPNH